MGPLCGLRLEQNASPTLNNNNCITKTKKRKVENTVYFVEKKFLKMRNMCWKWEKEKCVEYIELNYTSSLSFKIMTSCSATAINPQKLGAKTSHPTHYIKCKMLLKALPYFKYRLKHSRYCNVYQKFYCLLLPSCIISFFYSDGGDSHFLPIFKILVESLC